MYILEGMPFVAPDYASAWLLKDLQKEYFAEKFAKEGTRVLFYVAWPGQGFYTKFTVETVEAFKDKNVRIYSEANQKKGEMLGFNTTLTPFAERPREEERRLGEKE